MTGSRLRALLVTLALAFCGACDDADYREKLTIRADRSGTVEAEFRVSRFDAFIQLIAQQLGRDDIPLFDLSLLEKIPEGLKLDSFEDLSNDQQFRYRFVISFEDVEKLRQIDDLLPGREESRTTLFRELSWEEKDGSWIYRRQLGNGTVPDSAADRRQAREMGFRFHFELVTPEPIDRSNAETIENDVARWTVSFADVLDAGGRYILSAEAGPSGSLVWVLLPIALAGIFIASGRLRSPSRGQKKSKKKKARTG